MSDLERRNVQIMVDETKRMHAEVEELRDHLRRSDDKINALFNELADVKQRLVMASVQAQVERTGTGGTADAT